VDLSAVRRDGVDIAGADGRNWAGISLLAVAVRAEALSRKEGHVGGRV
jgi:hypothetical protein